MKRKLLVYAFIPAVLGLGVIGAGVASANGWFGGFSSLTPDQIATRQQTMFQNEANLLGISVDDVKSGWAQGKSLVQIAQDHGITQDQLTQKLQDARLAQTKVQLQNLVDKGIITQAQADSRLQFMQNNAGPKGRMGMMGFHGGMGL